MNATRQAGVFSDGVQRVGEGHRTVQVRRPLQAGLLSLLLATTFRRLGTTPAWAGVVFRREWVP